MVLIFFLFAVMHCGATHGDVPAASNEPPVTAICSLDDKGQIYMDTRLVPVTRRKFRRTFRARIIM